ncbi:hypothetical protein JD844_011953, partial [Phrynosoma platyrhinos]
YIVKSKWTANPTVPPEKLVVICNVSEEEEASVYWKKGQKWKGTGKELEITVKEPLDAGNYTYTKDRTFFKCTANNYSGNFKCFWTSTIQDSNLHFEVVTGSQAG